MTRMLLKMLLFGVAIVNLSRADDVADNKLKDGEKIYKEDDVEEGQVDNMSVESADQDTDASSATHDIIAEKKGLTDTHAHITFRSIFVAKKKSLDHQGNAKKHVSELYEDKIAKYINKQNILPIDGSKELVTLSKVNNYNIRVELNFHPKHVDQFVQVFKNMKEVLVIQYATVYTQGEHKQIWGVQADPKEIEEHSYKLMKTERSKAEKEADRQRASKLELKQKQQEKTDARNAERKIKEEAENKTKVRRDLKAKVDEPKKKGGEKTKVDEPKKKGGEKAKVDEPKKKGENAKVDEPKKKGNKSKIDEPTKAQASNKNDKKKSKKAKGEKTKVNEPKKKGGEKAKVDEPKKKGENAKVDEPKKKGNKSKIDEPTKAQASNKNDKKKSKKAKGDEL